VAAVLDSKTGSIVHYGIRGVEKHDHVLSVTSRNRTVWKVRYAALVADPSELVETDDTTWALRDVFSSFAAANSAIAKHLDLSPNDYAAIEHLLANDTLGPVELGQRLGIRSASATVLVDRLEASGHVQRHDHPTDRRRRTLAVTPKAVGELMQSLGPLIDQLGAVASALSLRDRAVVHRYLVAVAEVMWEHARHEEEPS
jgi:DNA-binding MarR family transcriptional regulator